MATQSELQAPTCSAPCTSATKQGLGDLSCCGVARPVFPCGRDLQCPSVHGDTMVSHAWSFLLQERSEIQHRHPNTRVSTSIRRSGHKQQGIQCSNGVQTSPKTQANPLEDPQLSAKALQQFPCRVTTDSSCWKVLAILHKPRALCQPPDPHQDFRKPLRTSHASLPRAPSSEMAAGAARTEGSYRCSSASVYEAQNKASPLLPAPGKISPTQ